MTPHKKRAGIFFVTLITLACFFTIIYYFYFYKRDSGGPKVEKSITEILAERSAQAKKKIESPLGQIIVSKNWVEFDRVYQKNTQYQELAETIRGAFIQNALFTFTPNDFDELILRVVHTIQTTDEKTYPKLGLLISQFHRLPAPTKNSEAFKILKSWLNTSNKYLKKLALFKLVGSDSDPDEAAVKIYLHGFAGDTFGITKLEWFKFADEIRSIKVKKICITELSKIYTKLDPKIRPYVLSVLSKNPSIESEPLLKYTFHALSQNDIAYIEAALKAIPNLYYNKNLTLEQKEKIIKRLDEIPESVSTPYIRIKRTEIRQLLSSKN